MRARGLRRRASLTVLLFSALTALTVGALAGGSSAPTLDLSLEQSSYQPGESVTVTVTVVNPAGEVPVWLAVLLEVDGGYYSYPDYDAATAPDLIYVTLPEGLATGAVLGSFPLDAALPARWGRWHIGICFDPATTAVDYNSSCFAVRPLDLGEQTQAHVVGSVTLPFPFRLGGYVLESALERRPITALGGFVLTTRYGPGGIMAWIVRDQDVKAIGYLDALTAPTNPMATLDAASMGYALVLLHPYFTAVDPASRKAIVLELKNDQDFGELCQVISEEVVRDPDNLYNYAQNPDMFTRAEALARRLFEQGKPPRSATAAELYPTISSAGPGRLLVANPSLVSWGVGIECAGELVTTAVVRGSDFRLETSRSWPVAATPWNAEPRSIALQDGSYRIHCLKSPEQFPDDSLLGAVARQAAVSNAAYEILNAWSMALPPFLPMTVQELVLLHVEHWAIDPTCAPLVSWWQDHLRLPFPNAVGAMSHRLALLTSYPELAAELSNVAAATVQAVAAVWQEAQQGLSPFSYPMTISPFMEQATTGRDYVYYDCYFEDGEFHLGLPEPGTPTPFPTETAIPAPTVTATRTPTATVTLTPTWSGTPATATPTPTVPPVPTNFVLLPAGGFVMGSPLGELCRRDDETQHPVTLTRAVYLQQTEVTQAQWTAVFGTNPSQIPGPDHPVESVTWFDAVIYCNRISELASLRPCYYADSSYTVVFDGIPPVTSGDVFWDQTAPGYRLPTEAEWEYACRATTTSAYYNGSNTGCFHDDNLDPIAWYAFNSDNDHHEVGHKLPNQWNLFDIAGNISEWCWDWYGEYPTSEVIDPVGPLTGEFRIIRGGDFATWSTNCRSAARLKELPSGIYPYNGFRICRYCSQFLSD